MFTRAIAIATVTVALLASNCYGQRWVTDMFESLDHDFQTVARGSDTVYKFKITNKYEEPVRLVSVRSSCGCTSPSLENKELDKSFEEGYVVAKFNTRTFRGLHSATLTVDVDFRRPGGQWHRGQAQLRVHGNIRGDIVFEPGGVVFGDVDQGDKPEKRVSVTYSGRPGWKITDVRSASDNLEVELTERYRQGGRVVYDLLGRMKADATPGILKEQLVIVTNDSNNLRVPIDVEARVKPSITVSPERLSFGEVEGGQQKTMRVLVGGKKPFKVIGIECKDSSFTFKVDEEARVRHLVQVSFDATGKPGAMKVPFVIKTDRGERFVATCMAYATIGKAEPDSGVAESSDSDASVSQPSSTGLAKDSQ